MPRPAIKTYEQILSELTARLVANTGLSDVSETSVAKQLLAVQAQALAEFYYQLLLLKDVFSIERASGEDLDERAKDIQPGILQRIQAAKAVGTVVISRDGTSGTVVIPIGTKVKTAGGAIFSTTAEVSITPTSPEIIAGHGVGKDISATAIAAEAGAEGNVGAGSISKFVQKPVGVNTVTNLNPMLYGADKESDSSFRNRLQNWVNSLPRSTITSLESAVLGAIDPASGAEIKFSKIIEDVVNPGYSTLYVDDGVGNASQTANVTGEVVIASALGGETVLYLDNKPIAETPTAVLTSSISGALALGTDYTLNRASSQINLTNGLTATESITATYTHYLGLIALAQKIIDGDPTDRVAYPGYRAAGTIVYVLTPQIVVQNISLTLFVREGYDSEVVTDNVKSAIKSYINGLSISDDLLLYRLVEQIMGVDGVLNATILTPTADVVVLDDQLIRVTDSNIEVL